MVASCTMSRAGAGSLFGISGACRKPIAISEIMICRYEGKGSIIASLNDTGYFAYDSAQVAPYDVADLNPAIQFNNFRGQAALLNLLMYRPVFVNQASSATQVFVYGCVDFHSHGFLTCALQCAT